MLPNFYFERCWAMSGNLPNDNKEPEGISIRINKVFRLNNLSRRKRALLWKWTKGVFAMLLTLSGVSNYYGIKITRESVSNNAVKVETTASDISTLQADVEACKKTNAENQALKITFGNLIDSLDDFLKRPNRNNRLQLDSTILKAKQQLGKPIGQADSNPLRANPILPAMADTLPPLPREEY
jgi:hypothetical protein